jgi:hypothetical protein
MNRNSKNLCLGFAVLFAGLSTLAINHYSKDNRFRTLGDWEMLFDARGAAPAKPCLTGFRTGYCEDYLAFCASKQPGDCKGQSCIACTNVGKDEEVCTTDKPWNALTCTTQPIINGGCGNRLTGTTCQWDMIKGCQCKGAPGDATCGQSQATSTGVGTCIVQ